MSERPKSVYIIGIAGGSGSGKSTIARSILTDLPKGSGILLEQDHYYRSQGNLPKSEREKVNYDHPDALEMELFIRHLDALRRGETIERPTYDFATQPCAAWRDNRAGAGDRGRRNFGAGR